MAKPYEIVGELKRFDRRNISFARSRWDKTSIAYNRLPPPVEELAAQGRTGYGVEDFALHAGAWMLARFPLGVAETPVASVSGLPEITPRYMEASPRADANARYVPPDWTDFTARVKQAAKLYGAPLAGVCRVDPLWLYAEDGDGTVEQIAGLDTAVVMALPMDYQLVRSSPAVPAAAATGQGYSQMAFTAACMARFLTELGWRAIAAGNELGLSIPMAVDAGLGEMGRNGLLVTRQYGPRVRLCKVFTDAPLVPDRPDSFGVREFCKACKKCAADCPSQSIPHGEMTAEGPTVSNNPGVKKWYVNGDKCLAYWREHGATCSNCIRSCPFNKVRGWSHDLVRWFIRARLYPLNRAIVLMDDLLGYGRQCPAE